MGRLKTIARRSFLIGSAAITSGVVFGVYAYRTPPANPLLKDLAEGETAITPYVKIDANGITLITPRADLGQGAYSVQAALIAEELDVDLDQVRVDPGQPGPAYYNTALAGDAAPFRATDTGFVAESARSAMDVMMKFLGMQITGGSTTVPDGYEKLRMAGAVARETLKAAAAQATGASLANMKTERGAVILPNGDQLPYTELAAKAAELDPVTDIALRPPSAWRLLGKPMQRIDIVGKSTGTLTYGIDRRIDGMLFATLKTNPANGGGMRSYDAKTAEAMPGVRKIVALKNGVAVVADNTWRAFQAADAIDFDWGPSPYPEEMEAHWQTLSDSFTQERQDSRMRDDGDVDAALDGTRIVEAEYRAPYLAHAPLEPISCLALFSQTRIDVWTANQIPRFTQKSVARLTGLDQDDVGIHVEYCGGSFGHRLEDEVVKQTVEVAMAMPGTPILLTYSREEDMLHDYHRQIAMARLRGRVDDGKVRALDLGIAMPSVTSSQMSRQGFKVPGPDTQIVAGAWDQPYDIPDYRVTGYRAPDLAPISSWRSVGAASNGFFHECALDELIHAAGADPMAERIRLMWHADSRRTLETVAQMSNWGETLPAGTGRGVAFTLSFGVPCAQVVQVRDDENGLRIQKVWVAAEVGRVLDPVNFENLVQGGVIWGLGHAMNCEITFSGGIAEQDNFYAYEGMRLHQTPEIHVKALEHADKIRGIGEPPVPPASAALANAIFAATGKRLREMPFSKFVDFA